MNNTVEEKKRRREVLAQHLLNEFLHWSQLSLVNEVELMNKVYEVLEGGVQVSLQVNTSESNNREIHITCIYWWQ